MAIIISADDIKKTLSGYNPSQSHLVHRESTRIADSRYHELIKTSGLKEVILLSGGAASGKTEFMSEYLLDKDSIIVDGTLPSFEGAKIKSKEALKNGKSVRIIAVWPADLNIAFGTFLQRDRKFPDEHFYRTHSQSRKALLDIAKSDLDVGIEIYESVLSGSRLEFNHYVFDTSERIIEFIRLNQYTENEIIVEITKS